MAFRQRRSSARSRDALRQGALDRGDEHSLTYVAFHLGRIACLAGDWPLAARYADECFETMAQTGREDERPFALTLRALVDAHLGRVAAARAATDEGLPLALELGVAPAHLELLAIRGFLEHSLGDAREAQRFLGPLPPAVAAAGFGEPALFRFHGDAVETLLALGERNAAAALLAGLEEEGAALERVWALTASSASTRAGSSPASSQPASKPRPPGRFPTEPGREGPAAPPISPVIVPAYRRP